LSQRCQFLALLTGHFQLFLSVFGPNPRQLRGVALVEDLFGKRPEGFRVGTGHLDQFQTHLPRAVPGNLETFLRSFEGLLCFGLTFAQVLARRAGALVGPRVSVDPAYS
jgi:hypothetical protein